MSPLAKVFVVINLVLAICFLGITSTLFSARKQWKSEYQELVGMYEKDAGDWKEQAESWKGTTDELSGNLNSAESDRDRLKATNDQLQANNEDLNTRIAKMEADLVSTRAEIANKNGHLQQKDGEIERLTQRNEALVQETQSAKAANDAAQYKASRVALDNNQLNQQLADANTLTAELQKERDELFSHLERVKEINPDLYTQTGLNVPPPPIDGQVLAVRPDEGIVVISVGGDEKVLTGYEFTVFRQDQFLGKVKVTKVTPDLSGAKILYNQGSIQVGDSVSTRLSY